MSKILLLTGASGGLARSIMDQCNERDWTPVAISRNQEAIDALQAQGIAAAVADVSTPEGAAKAIEYCRATVGSVPDALVNCAGQVLIAPAHRTTAEQYRACMAANIDTSFFSLQAFVSALRDEKKSGAAVLVSTVAAQIGVQNHEAVAASKGAVEALVRSAAATYAAGGIRVNGIAPGLTETPAVAQLMRSDANRQALARQYPLGRFGQPGDLAAAVLWLLSSEADWITGQILAVDGGFTSIRPMVR